MNNAGSAFENEVRTIARALWPNVPGTGGPEIVDGRERDCIYPQEDIVHYIEITISRKLDKIKIDSKKMVFYRDKQEKKGKVVKLWIVTSEEPTAEMRQYCAPKKIDILSIEQFRRKIIDASQYLELRRNHSFGSAVNPKNDSSKIDHVYFQPVKIRNLSTGEDLNIGKVAQLISNNIQIILIGDFGTGKSFNIWQLFLTLSNNYHEQKGDSLIPVVLNLREHWGQTSPDEALRRHAEIIGFNNSTQLVRAYNAGRLAIILDGFDEISATPWAKTLDRLRELRSNAVQLVKNFVNASKGKSPILIAGREHFFDSIQELKNAFSLDQNAILLNIFEFSLHEAKEYLRNLGFSKELPDWFPKRPLLLSSLAARDLINTLIDSKLKDDPALAWDNLIDLICKREAQIHKYLDHQIIRKILESLANDARQTFNNLGPITENNIAEAFRLHLGSYPDETARPLLQRLPGLSSRNQQDGNRCFLDDQMVDALRGGAIINFIQNPYNDPFATKWMHGIGSLGAQVVSSKLIPIKEKVILSALREALSRWKCPTLAADILQVILNLFDEQINFENIKISDGYLDVLDLVNLPSPIGLSINSFIINELILPNEEIVDLELNDCIIQKLYGISQDQKMPTWIKGCEFGEYDQNYSNAQILELSKQPIQIRVLLTILRKLFMQKGSGRRENGLHRGMDENSRKYVPEILEILESLRIIYKVKRRDDIIWYNISGNKQRIFDILDTGGRNQDIILEKVRKL